MKIQSPQTDEIIPLSKFASPGPATIRKKTTKEEATTKDNKHEDTSKRAQRLGLVPVDNSTYAIADAFPKPTSTSTSTSTSQLGATNIPDDKSYRAFAEYLRKNLSKALDAETFSEHEKKIVTDMVNTAQRACGQSEDECKNMLGELVRKTQFELEEDTRRVLTKFIRLKSREFKIDCGEFGQPSPIYKQWLQTLAMAAYLKVTEYVLQSLTTQTYAEPLTAFWAAIPTSRNRQPSVTRNNIRVANRILTNEQKKRHEIQQTISALRHMMSPDERNILASQIDGLDLDQIEAESIEDVRKMGELKAQNEAIEEGSRQVKEALGIDIYDSSISDSAQRWMSEQLKRMERICPSVTLGYAPSLSISLKTCVLTLKSGTLFPGQLLSKITILCETLELPAKDFETITERLKRADQEIVSHGDIYSSVDYALNHIEDYIRYGEQIEEIIPAAQKRHRAAVKKNKTREGCHLRASSSKNK